MAMKMLCLLLAMKCSAFSWMMLMLATQSSESSAMMMAPDGGDGGRDPGGWDKGGYRKLFASYSCLI